MLIKINKKIKIASLCTYPIRSRVRRDTLVLKYSVPKAQYSRHGVVSGGTSSLVNRPNNENNDFPRVGIEPTSVALIARRCARTGSIYFMAVFNYIIRTCVTLALICPTRQYPSSIRTDPKSKRLSL